eukprot:7221948-Prymnesium_polylepis.1
MSHELAYLLVRERGHACPVGVGRCGVSQIKLDGRRRRARLRDCLAVELGIWDDRQEGRRRASRRERSNSGGLASAEPRAVGKEGRRGFERRAGMLRRRDGQQHGGHKPFEQHHVVRSSHTERSVWHS